MIARWVRSKDFSVAIMHLLDAVHEVYILYFLETRYARDNSCRIRPGKCEGGVRDGLYIAEVLAGIYLHKQAPYAQKVALTTAKADKTMTNKIKEL